MATLDIDDRVDRRRMLRRMLLIREFENAVKENFADGEIPGFVHLSIGQEAVAVGACSALEPDDYVTSTHRAHGHCLATGLDERRLMAELYGREDGYCRGKGGSMHAAALDEGMLGAQPIVGASVPLATGASLTAQLRDTGWVGLGFLGDGAVAAGQVHESINLAATWDLPAIYVVENNLYSEGMTFEKQHNIDDIADSAAAYGIPGVIVDGMDAFDVYEAVAEARERAVRGEGPTLIEAKTYRYRGHFEGDPEPYRTEEEVREWRENRDAIDALAERLTDEGVIDADELAEMRSSVEADIEAAVEHARDAPFPEPEQAYEDVFVEPNPDVSYHRERLGRTEASGTGGDAGRSIPDARGSLPDDGEELTIREALLSAIREEMQRDETVFLMGQDEEDGGSFEVTAGLYEEFGRDRVRDTPISEAAQVGSGIGAAATGIRPVVNLSYSDFMAVCFDAIMNQAAKLRYMFGGAARIPLTVRAIEGGGFNAAAQHSSTPHTLVGHLPGIKAVAPGTARGSKGLMKTCIRSDDPVVFFEHKSIYERTGPVPEDPEFTVPLGEAAVLREGADVTLVATQKLVDDALSVASNRADVDVEVIDPQSITPLDVDTIAESVRKTGRLVVADESPLSYGLHAEIATRAAEGEFYSLDVPIQRVGVPDTPLPFSPPLEEEILPGTEEISTAIDRIA